MSVAHSRLTALALLAAVAVPVTACGGGTSSPGPAAGSPENPLVAKNPPADEPDAPRPARPASGAKLPRTTSQKAGGTTSSAAPHQRSAKRSQPATTGSETRAGGPASGPCRLVTEAQAQAIFGEPVQAPVIAKQGPTCIYRTRSGTRFLTLTVQATQLSAVKKDLRQARAVSVSDRTGYCGTLGQPMLYVPVGGGRMLAISAGCSVARQFAGRAIPRLIG